MSKRLYYAIGDIHGEHERLRELHEAISDHRKLEAGDCPVTILHLGDYVDRGPDSRGVVDRLMMMQSACADRDDIEVVCLLGNHERMMIDALDKDDGDPAYWLRNGGQETLDSYARAAPSGTPLMDVVPRDHIDWMKSLPTWIIDREAGFIFVHAGVRPETYPDCDEGVRLWIRSEDFMDDYSWPKNPALDGLVVVHGHTPTEGEPYVGRRRINLDTGAVYGGPLTAAIFAAGEKARFLYT